MARLANSHASPLILTLLMLQGTHNKLDGSLCVLAPSHISGGSLPKTSNTYIFMKLARSYKVRRSMAEGVAVAMAVPERTLEVVGCGRATNEGDGHREGASILLIWTRAPDLSRHGCVHMLLLHLLHF